LIVQNGDGTSYPTSSPSPAAAAGEISAQKTLSVGTYIVRAASIHTDNAFDEECRISFVDDTGLELCLASGVVSNNRPFALESERTITGGGYLRAYVIALGATTFDFVSAVDKVREEKDSEKRGGFGGWF